MSLLSALSVSASGLTAQRTRAELLVENLANAAQGSPSSAEFQREMGSYSNGVEVSDIYTDQREPDKRFLPGHPDADASGYVAFPRVNPAEDMVDLMAATRGFDANVSAMSAVKDMIQKSIDLLK